MNPELFSQVFGVISENAARGAQGTGEVADWLIGFGLSAAAITQILNGVATSAAATPQQVAYVQNELRYLQDAYYQPRTNWLVPALVVGALLYAVSRD